MQNESIGYKNGNIVKSSIMRGLVDFSCNVMKGLVIKYGTIMKGFGKSGTIVRGFVDKDIWFI